MCYANASAEIGYGHIMRSKAIAHAFLDIGYSVCFISKYCPQFLVEDLQAAGFSFSCIEEDDLTESKTLHNLIAKDADPAVLLVDDYFLSDHERMILNTKCIDDCSFYLLSLDDAIDDRSLNADVIINHASDITEEYYRERNITAKLLLGYKFAYLRPEFEKENVLDINKRDGILVTLGGSDVLGLSYPIVSQLCDVLPDVPITLVIGDVSKLSDAQYARLKAYPKLSVIKSANNMARLMSKASLAVTAAGGTLFELGCMGVPSIALVCADNQLPAFDSKYNGSFYRAIDARASDRSTCELPHAENSDEIILNNIIEMVLSLWCDKCLLTTMSNKAMKLIDAKGCYRIAQYVDNRVITNS